MLTRFEYKFNKHNNSNIILYAIIRWHLFTIIINSAIILYYID